MEPSVPWDGPEPPVAVKNPWLRALSVGAGRLVPLGDLASLESPQAVARLLNGGLLPSLGLTTAMSVLFFAFGESLAGWMTVGQSVFFLLAYLVFALTGRVILMVWIVCIASVADHVGVHIALGGFANSGAYYAWGIALSFTLAWVSRKAALGLAAFYAVLGIGLVLVEETLSAGRPPPSTTLSLTLFGLVFVGNLGLIVVLEVVLLRRFSFEKARAEQLLLNVLPAEVAAELKEHGRTTARRFESASVLFADVVGFTQMAAASTPEETVARLNALFTGFDSLVLSYGCEKIHTIGDAYVVAAGVPVESARHADTIAALALEMREFARSVDDLALRFGISSGPVVGGVIGSTKFQYDIWGDTVNVASRMESQGAPGQIQLSEATLELLSDGFVVEPRGEVEVKGIGVQRTWFLNSTRGVVQPVEGQSSSGEPPAQSRFLG